jgi:hypothetical protein
MKVLSIILSVAVLGQLSLLPASAQVAQPMAIPVDNSGLAGTGCAPQAVIAPQTMCAPAVVTRPAVVECPTGPNVAAMVGAAVVLGGIATAIAVPLAVRHHNRERNRRRQAALQQQQLLLFAEQQRIASLSATVGPTFVPGFGLGTVVPGIGFVPAP